MTGLPDALPESGANMMQAKAPVEKIGMYLDGFHAARTTQKCRWRQITTATKQMRTSRSACCSTEIR